MIAFLVRHVAEVLLLSSVIHLWSMSIWSTKGSLNITIKLLLLLIGVAVLIVATKL